MNPKQNGVEIKHKPQNRNPNFDAGFIAPDGGWGWLVVVAAGCSNVSSNRYTNISSSLYNKNTLIKQKRNITCALVSCTIKKKR